MGGDRRQGRERDANGRYAHRLSPAIVKKLCDLVREGNYLDVAAAATGLSRWTVREWMRDGATMVRDLARFEEEGKPLPTLTAHQKLEVQLSLGIDQARAEAEVNALQLIDKVAKSGQWTAAAWRLERMYPDRYGRRTVIQNADGQPFQLQQMPSVDLSLLTNDEVAELQRLLVKATPQPGNVIEMPARRRELNA